MASASTSPESLPMGAAVIRERVALPGRETTIEIGRGVRARLWERVTERFPGARRAGVVIDAQVEGLWPLPEPPAGVDPVVCTVPGGEAAKQRAVLAELQDRLIELRRDEPVIVIGGGATLDVGGFAAATLRRGLGWLAVPTTVIGMADAAVGGKVAINHPRGKNLLGTFHAPCHVSSDIEYLETLEDRDRVSGLAELYKCGRVGDAELVANLRRGPPADAAAWIGALGRSVAVKARLVEQDERDVGVRRLLNYGHTVGHALERRLGTERVRHGEAVAVGMQVAARLACARSLLDAAAVTQQGEDLERLRLPVAIPSGIGAEDLLQALGYDKKRAAGDTHTFVLPTGDHGAIVVDDVTDDEIRAALGP